MIKAGKPLHVQKSVSVDSEAPDIMFICPMIDYCIHAYIEAVRYIFFSKICFCVLMVQVADSCCVVKIKNDIFIILILPPIADTICQTLLEPSSLRHWHFYQWE